MSFLHPWPALLIAILMLAPPGHATASADGGIEHVVLCWLKDSTEANRTKVIETTREMASIPGILELRVGAVLPSDRKVVDDSFDVGITMTFASREDMQRYIEHEEHVERLREVFLPLCRSIRVHDFTF